MLRLRSLLLSLLLSAGALPPAFADSFCQQFLAGFPGSWFVSEVYPPVAGHVTFRMVNRDGQDQRVTILSLPVASSQRRLHQLESLQERVRREQLSHIFPPQEIFDAAAIEPFVHNHRSLFPHLTGLNYSGLVTTIPKGAWYSRLGYKPPAFIQQWGPTQRAQFSDSLNQAENFLKQLHMHLPSAEFAIQSDGSLAVLNLEDAVSLHRPDSNSATALDLRRQLSDMGIQSREN